jgi:hypothetical protein
MVCCGSWQLDQQLFCVLGFPPAKAKSNLSSKLHNALQIEVTELKSALSRATTAISAMTPRPTVDQTSNTDDVVVYAMTEEMVSGDEVSNTIWPRISNLILCVFWTACHLVG